MKTEGRMNLAEQFDPRAQLLLLEASLKKDLGNQQTALTVRLQRAGLTVAYHQMEVLRWTFVRRNLVCIPIGWCHKTYITSGPVQAREITIRLVFEFVRQLQSPT
jgi:hypothetical protein